MGHKVPNNIHGFSCSNSYYYLAASQIWIPTITTIPLTVSTVELSRAFFSSQALEAVGGHEWCKSLCGASDGRLLSCYGIFCVHLVKLPCSTVTLDGLCGGRRKKTCSNINKCFFSRFVRMRSIFVTSNPFSVSIFLSRSIRFHKKPSWKYWHAFTQAKLEW